eukprot:8355066-Lingulodinium_polyedra.AAC.1
MAGDIDSTEHAGGADGHRARDGRAVKAPEGAEEGRPTVARLEAAPLGELQETSHGRLHVRQVDCGT